MRYNIQKDKTDLKTCETNSTSMEPHQCNPFALFLCMFWLLIITSKADSGWDSMSQKDSHKAPADWLNHGGDLYNRRYASTETDISPETTSKLRLKWEFYAGNDITATPAIFNGTLYFPSWNGYLYAVKASDGSLVWKQNLQNLTGLNATGFVTNVNWTVSRSTPTIVGDMLIIGIYGPAVVIGVDRATGRLAWSTRLESNPAGAVTMSGTFHNGSFYVGTSSFEEKLSIKQCCIFRGSLSKLDIKTGTVLWQTYVLPDNHGEKGEYAGGAIWGSSPSIDVLRNFVYIATGNLYSAPLNIRECQEQQNNQTVPTQPDPCIEPDNHSNSILAFDLDSGKVKWYRQLGGYDLWFRACSNLSTPNCPPGPNPDADFGEAPMMLSIYLNGTMLDIVVAVQKSGFAWALDRDDGSLVWYTEAGPGGVTGGGAWGAATDGKRVYTNILNSDGKNFTLKPSNTITNAGGWVAMDANTGKTLWSTANPSNASTNGPVTIANGVLFAGSTHPTGPMYAMEAASGRILWSHNTGASVFGGASVSNGCIYVGSGYNVNSGPHFSFTGGTSLFAFCLS
ncbi:polyvinylalcohol dehydrogenase-like [Vitis riparia]|uniref:polyvinylalcohol dehydrogenase-like n=1 Tax=Vitis riparia TaxID=96939 RepID=UPI00155A73CF|nr:polyvinylalcohol dehydrogenase-like [Vitis riparia]